MFLCQHLPVFVFPCQLQLVPVHLLLSQLVFLCQYLPVFVFLCQHQLPSQLHQTTPQLLLSWLFTSQHPSLPGMFLLLFLFLFLFLLLLLFLRLRLLALQLLSSPPPASGPLPRPLLLFLPRERRDHWPCQVQDSHARLSSRYGG